MTNVLIVEDDEGVGKFLRQVIKEQSWQAQRTEDGEHALELLHNKEFDLMILDVMLPGIDGLEVCRRLRHEQHDIPVLIITARDALEDKIAGLDAGADDYLCKPFEMDELLARARALLRRRKENDAHSIKIKDLTINPITRQVRRGGKNIRLSATEYRLLYFLASNCGKVMERQDILDYVWQYDFGGNDNVLDVYVSYLRKKVDKDREPLIHTVRAVGFQMGDYDEKLNK